MNIISYGSLLNIKSLEKSLGRKSKLTKIYLPGYERVFNAPFGSYSYLNLQKNENSFIEAAYFILEKKELEKFSEREAGAGLIEVLTGYFAFIWPEKYCKELPVLQSYINICETGSRKLKINLWKNAIVPKKIKNDSLDPEYF